MDANCKIAEWAGFVVSGSGKWISRDRFYTVYPAIAPVTSFEFWHTFLFPLIEERGLKHDFIIAGSWWMEDIAATNEWVLLTATPAQLAEALVKVIDEEKGDISGTRGKINSSTVLIGRT